METKESPLSTAPAFLILIYVFIAAVMNSRAQSVFLLQSAALLFLFSYILMGTDKFRRGYVSLTCVILAVSLILTNISLFISHGQFTFSDGDLYSGKGTVLLVRDWGSRSAAVIKTRDGRFVSYFRINEEKPECGTVMNMKGRYINFRNKAAEKNKFSERRYWLSKNVRGELRLDSFEILPGRNPFLNFRNILRNTIKEKTPPRMASYLHALTLGEREKQLNEVHRRTGTMHLLAVSGFHIALLAGILNRIFKKIRFRFFLTSIFLWLYIFISGAAPGAVRAGIMMQIWLLGKILKEPVSSFNSISVALSLMISFQPWVIYDVGFQLSASAALVISGYSSRLNKGFASGVVISLLVWLMSASLVMYHFGASDIAGLFNNIFAVPVFSVVFTLMLFVFTSALLPLPFISGVLCSFMEEFLYLWERFSFVCSDLLPYTLNMTLAFTAMSVFIFFNACTFGSGMKFNRCFTVSVLFTIMTLCFI